MVDYGSELSRSRTGIHGGLRRGTAAAAMGAVLVLSAGVPASQAADGADPGEPDARITGSLELPAVNSLLGGLLGSGSQATTQMTPSSPGPTATVSPSQVPTSPVPVAPTPTMPSPSPATSSAAAPTGTTSVAPAPAPDRQPGTVGAQPGAGSAAAGSAGPGSGPGGAGQPMAGQPAADRPADAAESPATAHPTAGVPSATASQTSRTGTLQSAGAPARSRQEMAPAPQPAVEAAKVWLGVGLLGSAGAAGLVFARIRRF